jgi:hypothetical protein
LLTTILAVVGFLLSIAIAFVGYFVHENNKKIDKLHKSFEKHDEKDDERFKEMGAKVDNFKEDMIIKRHSLRTEMREASERVYEKIEKTVDKLAAWIHRLEDKIDKK